MPFCPLDLENRMTVCMRYPAMTPKGSTDDCANRRSKEEVLAQHSNFCKRANSAQQKLAKCKRTSRKTPPRGGWKAMQGERQDVDSSVAEKNDVVKMTTLFSVTPMKGRNAYE